MTIDLFDVYDRKYVEKMLFPFVCVIKNEVESMRMGNKYDAVQKEIYGYFPLELIRLKFDCYSDRVVLDMTMNSN